MKLPLAYFGAPVLRKKGAQVENINEEIRTLVADMVDTMQEHKGIGLAAPQVHKSLALFITMVPIEQPDGEWKEGNLRVFINPKILSVSKETDCKSEGCLSIPKVYGDVVRPKKVVIQAQDLEGNLFEEEFSGLDARCVLHENDHINGVLFVDRIHGKERKELDAALREVKKKFS